MTAPLFADKADTLLIECSFYAEQQGLTKGHLASYEVADIASKAAVKNIIHEKVKVPFSPSSTVIGAAILNAVFAKSIENMAEQGFVPPIFLSGWKQR